MEKEEMTKIVNNELKGLLPSGLTELEEKQWRYIFNIARRSDLSQQYPIGGKEVSRWCIDKIKAL